MTTRNLIVITLTFLTVAPAAGSTAGGRADSSGGWVELSAEVLRDKIRGGLLGQMLGNLNGLQHEMKYINEPGNVQQYTPALPQGARTDDDTDLEWVYIVAMQRHNAILLPSDRIVQLWKKRINQRIWCSNQYARQLMDIGFEPPLTGSIVFNPWAEFNISGQFVCETFGLLAPGMPQTTARIGLNYTRVTIDAEPAQTTQLFTAMIATAFMTDDIDAILDAGLKAIDADCTIREIVNDVRQWHGQYPEDWRVTRRLVREKYSRHNGAMRDRNGYELNTASTIAALLYGRADFVKTLMTAFNFGWDADNNAATAGTIVGVIKGYRWIMKQNWPIVDRYHNTTRADMPEDETITSFADRLIDLAERVIAEQGGQRQTIDGQIVYRIRRQDPTNILPLSDFAAEAPRLRAAMKSKVKRAIVNETEPRVRGARLAPAKAGEKLAFAAYSAICLDLAQTFQRKYPEKWADAIGALNRYPKVVQVLFFHSPFPAGDQLRQRAVAAGLAEPTHKVKIW